MNNEGDCISKTHSDYQVRKIRRRIEDFLRKTSDINILLTIARLLNIKTE
jgi:hypothetical protein